MKNVLTLMRVPHWVKNTLILIPFGLSSVPMKNIGDYISVFFIFGLLASCVYIFNDILDLESDQKHPIKKKRPIASGAISVKNALFLLAALCLPIAILVALLPQKQNTLIICGIYLGINLLYTFFLKKIKYIDLLCLTSFYLIRILLGFKINDISLSPIFILCCIMIFLSLSLNKRVGELALTGSEKLMKRGYEKTDLSALHLISIVSALMTLLLFNLHNIFFLKLVSTDSVIIINFLGMYLIFSFFDPKNMSKDDPIRKVLRSKRILLTGFLFVTYYLFLVQSSLPIAS